MKIFITGVAGFIGSSMAEAFLANGYEVFGIDNLFSGYESNIPQGISWIKADIREEDNFKKLPLDFDIAIHLAAQTSGEKSFEQPVYDMETNLKGTYNVYQFAKGCKAKLMVNMSSMSVYGDVANKEIVDEIYPPKPISLYGNTKLAAENMLNMLSAIDNLPVINLRLFSAYGPKQDLTEMKQGMVSIYLSYLINHDKVHVKGPMDRVRDFIYIDDVNSAVTTIIESESSHTDTYNLSTGTITSVKDLIDLLKSVSHIEKKIISKGNTPGDIVGFGGTYKKIESKFGWRPRIKLQEGLEKMISYYKELN